MKNEAQAQGEGEDEKWLARTRARTAKAKLWRENVCSMRVLYKTGATIPALSEQFGASDGSVRNSLTNTAWKVQVGPATLRVEDGGDVEQEERVEQEYDAPKKQTRENLGEMRQRYLQGEKVEALMLASGRTRGQVQYALISPTWQGTVPPVTLRAEDDGGT